MDHHVWQVVPGINNTVREKVFGNKIISFKRFISPQPFVYINFDNDSLFWLSNVIVPFIVNRTVKTY